MESRLNLTPSKKSGISTVELWIGNSPTPKRIGQYNGINKIFSTRRTDKQIHYKTQSIAFNYQLLQKLDISLLKVIYKNQNLYITKDYLIKVGQVYHFNNFEVQIFCRISEFSNSPEAAREKDNLQTELFN